MEDDFMKKLMSLFFLFAMSFAFASVLPESLNLDSEMKIYPLGFSQKSNFAYISYFNTGATCGMCPTYTFVVTDLYENKDIISKTFEASDENSGVIPFDVFWKRNRESFKNQLTKYEIHISSEFNLQPASFSYKESFFELSTKSEIKTVKFRAFEAPEEVDIPVISSYQIDLVMNRKNIKPILNGNENNYTESVSVLGSVISPYEDYAAILIRFGYIDSEGAHRNYIKIVGAFLTGDYLLIDPESDNEETPETKTVALSDNGFNALNIMEKWKHLDSLEGIGAVWRLDVVTGRDKNAEGKEELFSVFERDQQIYISFYTSDRSHDEEYIVESIQKNDDRYSIIFKKGGKNKSVNIFFSMRNNQRSLTITGYKKGSYIFEGR
jgi:hypothetical protein